MGEVTATLPGDRALILQNVDLVELLGRVTGLPVRVRGTHAMSGCPNRAHAQTGGSPPVSVDVTNGVWHCHGCGEGGTAIDVIRLAGGLDVREAFDAARELAGMPVHEWPLPAAPNRIVRGESRPLVVRTCASSGRLRDSYARKRRWTTASLDRLAVHVAIVGQHPRLVIPVDPGTPDQGWQARALANTIEPRWLTGRPLRAPFGCALAASSNVVLVVEGASDFVSACVLRDADPRFPVAVAAPGAQAWKTDWAQLLAGCLVIVVGDADAAGNAYVERVVDDCVRNDVSVCRSSFTRPAKDLGEILAHTETPLDELAGELLHELAANTKDIE